MTRSSTCATAVLTALAGLLAAASGCSSSNSRAHYSSATDPEPDFSQLAATHGDEAFVDPFNEPQSEAGNDPWADNAPRVGAGPVSVFGEIRNASGGPARVGYADESLTQVSFSVEGADFDPDIAKDGRTVVFASTQHSPTSDIYLKTNTGRTVTKLTSDPGNDVQPAISPDSKRVAFATDRGGNWDIYIMNITGGQPVQVSSGPAPEMHPSWSPDGKHIAYCRLGDVSGRWELWVTEAANPAIKRFIGYGLFPEWSPAGDTILFQRARERGDRFFGVWTLDYVNGEGVNPTEIVSSPVAATVNPTWAANGRRIAFTVIPNPSHRYGDKPSHADVWICDIDGTGRSNLTGGRFANMNPAWGADGRVYFVSDRSGSDNLWSLSPDHAIVAAGSGTPGTPGNPANASSNNGFAEVTGQ